MCETNHCMGTFHALKPVHGRENIIEGTKYTPKLSNIHTPSQNNSAPQQKDAQKTTTTTQSTGDNTGAPVDTATKTTAAQDKKKKPLIAEKRQPK